MWTSCCRGCKSEGGKMSERTTMCLAGPPLSAETHSESGLGRTDPPWLRGIAAVYCAAGSPGKLAQLQLDSKFH